MWSVKKTFIISYMLLLVALLITIVYYSYGVIYREQQIYREQFTYNADDAAAQMEETIDKAIDAAKLQGYSTACQRYLLSDIPSVVIDSRASLDDLDSYASLYVDGYTDMLFMSDIGRRVSQSNSYFDEFNAALEAEGLEDNYSSVREHFSVPIDNKYIIYMFPVMGVIDGYRYRYNQIVGGVIFDIKELLNVGKLDGKYNYSVILLKDNDPIGQTISDSASSAAIPNLVTEFSHDFSGIDEGESTVKLGHKNYILYRKSVNNLGISVVYCINKNSGISFTEGRLPIIFIVVFMLLIMILMVYILNALQKNITMMEQDIKSAEKELTPIRTPNITELQSVSHVVNNTFKALNKSYARETRLIQDNYEALIAQMNAEMIAYRNQINPHFLFNTLETARSLSHHYGAQPVEDLIGHMSKMFRYALYAKPTVPLSDEIDNLNSYVALMNIRFPGLFILKKGISDDSLDCTVITLLLQPLVENSVKHAFGEGKGGEIFVGSEIRNDTSGRELLHIRVVDNGKGIDADKLATFEKDCLEFRNQYNEETTYGHHMLTDKSHSDESIGLINIFRRLIMTFGDEARLQLSSLEGYYTKVDIYIPARVQTQSANINEGGNET